MTGQQDHEMFCVEYGKTLPRRDLGGGMHIPAHHAMSCYRDGSAPPPVRNWDGGGATLCKAFVDAKAMQKVNGTACYCPIRGWCARLSPEIVGELVVTEEVESQHAHG